LEAQGGTPDRGGREELSSRLLADNPGQAVLTRNGDDHLSGARSIGLPDFCTSEIVSVAQRVIDMIRRRSRGCGKVGSVLCFPLFHTPGMLRSAMLPALAIYNPAMSVV